MFLTQKKAEGVCHPFLQKEQPYSINLLLLLFGIIFLLLSGKSSWFCLQTAGALTVSIFAEC